MKIRFLRGREGKLRMNNGPYKNNNIYATSMYLHAEYYLVHVHQCTCAHVWRHKTLMQWWQSVRCWPDACYLWMAADRPKLNKWDWHQTSCLETQTNTITNMTKVKREVGGFFIWYLHFCLDTSKFVISNKENQSTEWSHMLGNLISSKHCLRGQRSGRSLSVFTRRFAYTNEEEMCIGKHGSCKEKLKQNTYTKQADQSNHPPP